LTREGKWDVKNLEKWKAVAPVSLPIANFFRALKTLREVDELHTPKVFVKDWAPEEGNGNGKDGLGAVVAVVDITHESPVYDYRGLESGGIAYRKFPTVSKFPPTEEEVKLFIEVVDSLRAELLPSSTATDAGTKKLIAVHCHYGFNRTGFFIVAYMVEKLGWPLKEAIAEFGAKRPPGVRHAHFVDELYARYWNLEIPLHEVCEKESSIL
jgi:protein-tyrosine phosphatase